MSLASSFRIGPTKGNRPSRSLAFGAEFCSRWLSARAQNRVARISRPGRPEKIEARPCDVGSVHVALTVDDLEAVLETIAACGWKAAGKPQTLTVGQCRKRVIYVRDPDGTTIELMQMPPAP